MKRDILLKALVAFAGLVTALPSQADLVFTIEGPGVQSSQVSGVITETFDTLPLGPFSGVTAVGTFSSGGSIVAPDAYGGANGSQYDAIGVQSGHTSATLTFNSAQHYFGMWWPAGDAQNHLQFYDGTTLLASYRVGDIIPYLSSAYYGNPNYPADQWEPFVYLNFTTTGDSSITSVKFLNDTTGSGFEIDNLSISDQKINPPGHTVPDGGSTAALLGAALALVGSIKRKFRG